MFNNQFYTERKIIPNSQVTCCFDITWEPVKFAIFPFFFFYSREFNHSSNRLKLKIVYGRLVRAFEKIRYSIDQHPDRMYSSPEQRCQCTSSGCTTCAVRRRRYGKNGRKEDRTKVANVGPIVPTNRNQPPDPCTAATGSIGVRAGSSNGPLCSPVIPSTRLPFRYPGNHFPQCMLSSLFVHFKSRR